METITEKFSLFKIGTLRATGLTDVPLKRITHFPQDVKIHKIPITNNQNNDSYSKMKIVNTYTVMGLIDSTTSTPKCTDTFDWTPRELAGGGTVNDQDNVKWICE